MGCPCAERMPEAGGASSTCIIPFHTDHAEGVLFAECPEGFQWHTRLNPVQISYEKADIV
jgi:hypothetical protein